MKFNITASLALAFLAGINIASAQRQRPPATEPAGPPTNYDYHDAFAPFFFTKNGNEYRAASGEPGPKYWQNRADYQLSAKLNDDANEITGTEVVTYTNNSPQK